MTTTVTIAGAGSAREAISRMGAEMRRGILADVETALAGAVKANFFRINEKPNRLGGERTNYWGRAADATVSRVDGSKVIVECAHTGVALHLHGGTVKPSGRTSEITGKPIRFLTIPVAAAAHGKSVATLRALGVNTYRAGGAIFRHPGLGGKVNPDTDEKLFVLAKQANIKAKPDTLPTEAALADAAVEAATEYLRAQGLA